MIVNAVVIDVMFLKAWEWPEDIKDRLFGFDLNEEWKSSFVLSFRKVLFERFLAFFLKDERIRFIDQDNQIGSVLDEPNVFLNLFVEFSGDIKLVGLFVVVVVGYGWEMMYRWV